MRKDPTDPKTLQEAMELFQTAIPMFGVLADVNRQQIIMELAIYDRLNVNQLNEKISLSRPAISHHLKALKMAAIVDCEKSGTENYYFLTLKDSVELMKNLAKAIENSCYLR